MRSRSEQDICEWKGPRFVGDGAIRKWLHRDQGTLSLIVYSWLYLDKNDYLNLVKRQKDAIDGMN